MEDWQSVLGEETNYTPDDPRSIAHKGIESISAKYSPVVFTRNHDAALDTELWKIWSINCELGWLVHRRVPMTHSWVIVTMYDFYSAVEYGLNEILRLRAVYSTSSDSDEQIITRTLHMEITMLAVLRNLCFGNKIAGADRYRMDFIGGLSCNFVEDNANYFTYVRQYRDKSDVQRYARRILQ